ncbi:MAG: branched-chain amino acid ABC transporter permease [Bacillota bacterium]|nr:branched-chain amino acid ABC transporter permease [Bacillota bacterium]
MATQFGWKKIRDYLSLIVTALFLLGLAYINVISGLGLIDRYYNGILILVMVNVILAVSLNLINGITGQFSIGHAGFMAVGAYVSALLSIHLRWPFAAVLVAGMAAAAVMGVVVGIPTLRLKGDYLAIATLGFGEIIRVVIVNLDITGGPRGLPGIPPKTGFFVAEALAALTILVISNLINSAHGRAMLAVREDEVAAETMGVNATRYKVTAFVVGAAFAGLAGGLYAHYMMFIDPKSFSFFKSVEVLVMVVLGGLGSVTGSILSAAVLTYLPEMLRQFAMLRMVIYSMLLIVMMLVRPQGLLGTWEVSQAFRDLWRRRETGEAGRRDVHGIA